MKTRTIIGIAAASIACAALFVVHPLTSFAQQKEAKAPALTKWEYKQVEGVGDAALSKLGEEGWEVVTVLGGSPYITRTESRTFQGITTNTNTIQYGKLIYVLKRPR